MSGGAWEYVAAYVNNGHGNLTNASNGKALTEGAAKYKNVYYSTISNGATTDSRAADYAYTNPNYTGTYPSGYSKKYGDAVWETSQNGTNTSPYAWYSDYSYFPYSSDPFFVRGGGYSYTSVAGVFCFDFGTGSGGGNSGFRVVVPVL